ncbi:MAG: dioxygenase [Cyanobacteria bacterium RM1_2_2]|nr:dioxygenase [Cyanobacteria bacterium RM1_2_2]
MTRFPTVFISHGSPLVMIDPELPGQALRQLGQQLQDRLPPIQAILVLSAHWLTSTPTVSTASQPEIIYDFYGFPAELYHLVYPAPGAPDLAAEIAHHLTAAGIDVTQQPHGLDHGAWMPLSLMFPQANIPVLQLSIQPRLNPEHHWRLGEALQQLRDQGVLIIGSGQLTHNLRDLDFRAASGASQPWAVEFANWMQQQIEHSDKEALWNYRLQAPHAARAHPTDEHLLPLFAAMGAAGAAPQVEHLPLGFSYGTLAWDSYLFW